MLFKKNQSIKEKVNELNVLLATLESKEIKYSLIYNIDEDILLTITDKSSQRITKAEIKEKKKKEE